MDFIKTVFTIKDLENLSGIKSHTIRIWEKRFELLSPERTKTNIRFYSTSNLKQLLNVVLLYNNGFKISNIAKLSHEELLEQCRELIDQKAVVNQFINDLKISMLNFDKYLFDSSYRKLNKKIPFQEIFEQYLLPFLNELGLLWQTNTINPAHEHFISNLIKHKILLEIEKLEPQGRESNAFRFILFLPDNEIHDLGLCFLNYTILNNGYSTIFLGQSVPIECLTSFSAEEGKLIFVSYFTVKPDIVFLNDYLSEINASILANTNSEFWILGQQSKQIDQSHLFENIKVFESINDLANNIDLLK